MKAPMKARRNFLAAGLAMPVAVGAAPVPAGGDDAELIALAERVVMAHRAYVNSYDPPAQSIEDEHAREPEQDRLWGVAVELAETLAPMVPTTMAGIVAKARAAYEMAEKEIGGALSTRGPCDLLAGRLLEDLAGVTRRADGLERA